MRKRSSEKLALLMAALLGGCWTPRPEFAVEDALRRLVSAEAEKRDAAFQFLIDAPPSMLPILKRALPAGPKQGFPVAALLTVLGEGESIPLDLQVRHLATFRWPAGHRLENALREPYAWSEIERDLVKAGTPALGLLARALEKDAPSEAKALQVARVMMRIGGRPAAREFARLLEAKRPFVRDVAAGALLYVGRQEQSLRVADGRVRAAREWWSRAKDQTAAEWTRDAVDALAARWSEGDPEGVRPVFELLVGEEVEDPRAWLEARPDWRPPDPPLRPEELLDRLSGSRPQVYEANRLLEEATGAVVALPRMDRLGELCGALRFWRADPDLAVRWRRRLENPLLRLSILVIGHHPGRGRNHVRMAVETTFHASEDAFEDLAISRRDAAYLMHVRTSDFGTRLVTNESVSTAVGNQGITEFHSGVRPVVAISHSLRSCVVVTVDEVKARRPRQPPEFYFGSARKKLRKQALETEGVEQRRALRGLGYFQDAADRDLFIEHGAWESLLMLGDPASLEHAPRLHPHEIEMALRVAEDPKVVEYLKKK